MQTIDLIKFLQNYYGIYHASLHFETLTHEDAEKLFPFIKRCKRGYLNLEDLQSGNVIGVYDKNKRVYFYYNPHLKLDEVKAVDYDNYEKKEVKPIDLEELENLSKDELLSIRRQLRLSDRRKESFLINTLIRKLKEREPRYYRERKLRLVKESYYD